METQFVLMKQFILEKTKIRWDTSVCHRDNYFDTKLSDIIF